MGRRAPKRLGTPPWVVTNGENIEDAHGNRIATVDPNRNLSDADVALLARWIVDAINAAIAKGAERG